MNDWQIIVQSMMEILVPRIGWTLVHSLWQGCAAAGGLWVALRAMRNASASARYVVACAILAIVVAALSSKKASREELDEIRKLIEQMKGDTP